MKKEPKYVKKAGQWCVTVFRNSKQEVHWFSTEKEAREFYTEQ